MKTNLVAVTGLFGALAVLLLTPVAARAHCDTLDGPVVTDARAALEKGDVTPALKWVSPASEQDIRAAFDKTLAVRRLSQAVRSEQPATSSNLENTLNVRRLCQGAKELADMYFFETLVRLHRAGEGAPYTGLKPAGEVEPPVAAADKALATGKVEPVVKLVTDKAADGIGDAFARVIEARKHMNDSVAAGREYVEAYVIFVHYVEGLYNAAAVPAGHGAPPHEAPPADHPAH